MSESRVDHSERLLGEVVYHFDVDSHSIPLKQFIDTARASQFIIDDFNEQYFDKSLRYNLHVKTPEKGTLLEVLQLSAGSNLGTFDGVI